MKRYVRHKKNFPALHCNDFVNRIPEIWLSEILLRVFKSCLKQMKFKNIPFESYTIRTEIILTQKQLKIN